MCVCIYIYIYIFTHPEKATSNGCPDFVSFRPRPLAGRRAFRIL